MGYAHAHTRRGYGITKGNQMTTQVNEQALALAKAFVANDKDGSLKGTSELFKSGAYSSPEFLLPTKPTKAMKGRAWGAWIHYKFPTFPTKDIAKCLEIIGEHHEVLLTLPDANAIKTKISAYEKQKALDNTAKSEKARKDGTLLSNQLEKLDEIISEMKKNPLSPTEAQKEAYASIVASLTALQGSFAVGTAQKVA